MILKLLERLGRKRIIYDRITGEPYLVRYYLLFKERRWFPFNIFIHKFLSSDPSDLHDHPWDYMTFIIKGGYFEWTPEYDDQGNELPPKRQWLGAGHFRYCRAESKHRIELMKGVDAWTIFIPMRQRREWGFWHDNKFINNMKYKLSRRSYER